MGEEEAKQGARQLCFSAHVLARSMLTGGERGVTEKLSHQCTASSFTVQIQTGTGTRLVSVT